MTRGTRPRCKRVEVWLTEGELAALSAKADSVKLSRSEYLRNLGLGFQLKSVFDKDAVSSMMKVRADQGRLGGLLKLWLAERKGEGVNASSVRSVLEQIESLQIQLGRIVLQEAKRL